VANPEVNLGADSRVDQGTTPGLTPVHENIKSGIKAIFRETH